MSEVRAWCVRSLRSDDILEADGLTEDQEFVTRGDYESLLSRVKELEAIVALLPKTADGAPLVFGTNYYVLFGEDDGTATIRGCGVLAVVIEEFPEIMVWRVDVRDEDGNEFESFPTCIYSTRAAALAAQEAP